jgi:hypothetical protein
MAEQLPTRRNGRSSAPIVRMNPHTNPRKGDSSVQALRLLTEHPKGIGTLVSMERRVSTSVQEKTQTQPPERKKKRGFFRRVFGFCCWLFLLVVIAGVIARPFMPRVILYYVNQTLNRSPLYQGKIGDIDLHLWRGAYTIKNVRILKTTGDVPVPLFACRAVDLTVEWQAILHRKIVGQVVMYEPEVNFVDAPTEGATETGAGGPWLKMISDLFPFDINSARLVDGSVHFRTYQKAKPVDVYLSHLNAQVDDLTNVNRSVTPLLTSVHVSALAMDQAKLEMHMKLDPFSYRPTFHLDLRLLGLDLTTTNDLIETYGGFNVKRGLFDMVLDVQSDSGQLTGYVKPLFRNMVVFDLLRDVQEDNPVQVFWQAVVGGVTGIVTNYNRNQLGTLIPFTGELETPKIDFLATLGNVLRNAFIRAYLPRLEQTMQRDSDLEFGAASPLTSPISVGD